MKVEFIVEKQTQIHTQLIFKPVPTACPQTTTDVLPRTPDAHGIQPAAEQRVPRARVAPVRGVHAHTLFSAGRGRARVQWRRLSPVDRRLHGGSNPHARMHDAVRLVQVHHRLRKAQGYPGRKGCIGN